jgi:phosphoglycolate phosphatase-like HAD superfamily hydrolase
MIEVIRPIPPHSDFRCALFDFDGTLSLVRAGWQQLMADFGVELLLQTPHHEPEAQLRAHITELVARTNGTQTINQMAAFAEEVRQRGGPLIDPQVYKEIFAGRLEHMVGARKAAYQRGEIGLRSLLVPGATQFLQALQQRGVICYLTSGTDHQLVTEETRLLGLEPYFAAVFGARQDAHNQTKAQVASLMVERHCTHGGQLIAFGDGYAEIEAAVQLGGVGVGVASDEAAAGVLNPTKRRRLIEAGASLVVADFSPGQRLAELLFGEVVQVQCTKNTCNAPATQNDLQSSKDEEKSP